MHFQNCWTLWKKISRKCKAQSKLALHVLFKNCTPCVRRTPIIYPDMQQCSNEREKPKYPHLSWFQYSRTYGRANQSCCNVVLSQVPQGQPVPWCRHWMLGSLSVILTNENRELSRDINSFRPMWIFSLCGSGPIMHCTIIDVGINYITAIRQADWCLLHKQRISIRVWGLVHLSGGDIWSGWPFNFL